MRLDKMLSNSGVGSRKDIKSLIKSGVVTVNGAVARKSDVHIDENKDEICVNGERINYQKYIYLMLNKPAGYVSATEDFKYPTVIDLVPQEFRHYDLFPVGRLDIDTEGLLILTNDGAYAHDMLSPKKHVYKTYYAKLDAFPTDDDIEAFKNGITIEGYKKCVTKYKVISSYDLGDYLEIDLITGRTHQIRAQMAHLGHPLAGDGKYGTNEFNKKIGLKYQALYSYKTEFCFEDENELSYLNGKTFEVDKKNIPWFKR